MPEGLALFDVLIPKMRRNRRGPGMSGTVAFMAKALKQSEETLLQALDAVGLRPAQDDNGKPTFVEAAGQLFWIKQDGRGGFWINSRDADKSKSKPKSESEKPEDEAKENESNDDSSSAPAAESESESTEAKSEQPKTKVDPGKNALPALRILLKPKTRGNGAAGEIDSLARAIDKPTIELLEGLVKAGLAVPDTADEKPVFVELGDEILWLKRNAKDDSLWLNAKEKTSKKRSNASRSRTKKVNPPKAASDESETAGNADGEESSDAG